MLYQFLGDMVSSRNVDEALQHYSNSEAVLSDISQSEFFQKIEQCLHAR